MLGEADRADRAAWERIGADLSTGLRRELRETRAGEQFRKLVERQIDLIRSIPNSAARRVGEMTVRGLEDSSRADYYVGEIMRSGEVAKSHAILIARTEVASASTSLTQARAQEVGFDEYIWRTSHDRDVRPGHKAMEGKICRWDDPPEVNENGRMMRHHPGQIWNCRCWAEPLIATPRPKRS